MVGMEIIKHGSGETVFFFSDVHLGGHDRETEAVKTRALAGFLRHAAEARAAADYIVGDLWDFGFEYRHCLPKEILWALAELSKLQDSGVRVHFLGGNHDFWINDFLVNQMGMFCYPGPVELELAGQRWFLAHGDGLSSDDLGYRILKQILRGRALVALYRILHPDIGIPFAKWVAGLGKTDREAEPDFPDLESVARRKITDEGYHGAIFGHRHYPKRERIDSGEIIVLGDWISRFSYLRYSNGSLTLEKWPVEDTAEQKNRPTEWTSGAGGL